jgi:hypothetical protein
MYKQAGFPDRCVKCNASAGGYQLKRKLSWHPPAYYFAILVNLLLYIVLALFVRKTAVIHVGLCPTHRRRRGRVIIACWTLFFASIAGCASGIGRDMPAMMLVAPVLVFAAIFTAIVGSQVVRPSKIDDRYVRLAGVHRSFLDTLPRWPHAGH